jgi:hypothetical protein
MMIYERFEKVELRSPLDETEETEQKAKTKSTPCEV